MNTVLIIAVTIGLSLQNIVKKEYNDRIGGTYIFAAVASFVAGVMFLVMGLGKFSFEQEMIPYSVSFAVSYGISTVFSVLAIANGSLALTSLVISYSLIIPTLWGIVFFNEPVGNNLVIGLAFLCVSLVLINISKRNKDEQTATITLKWIIYVFLAFVGNGMCSTIQKLQQDAFYGSGKNEFMSIALFIVSGCLLIIAWNKEKIDIRNCVNAGMKYMIICGLANGIVNLFVMILSNRMAASVMFPLISAGSIIMTAIVSMCLYKEKLNASQKIGLILGIVSIIFLNAT